MRVVLVWTIVSFSHAHFLPSPLFLFVCVLSLTHRPYLSPCQRPKYEVLDEDTGEGGEGGENGMPSRQKRYVLDPRKILPLPSLQEVPLSKRKEFGKGTRVLAVFPTGGITTLYPAEVLQPPRKVRTHTYTHPALLCVQRMVPLIRCC